MSPSFRPFLSFCLGTRYFFAISSFSSFRVASEFDQFHTIEQGSRDGGDAVGRREEENLREIEGNVDVVIVESFVLFRIECFKQCRSRITAEIRADLVDFRPAASAGC